MRLTVAERQGAGGSAASRLLPRTGQAAAAAAERWDQGEGASAHAEVARRQAMQQEADGSSKGQRGALGLKLPKTPPRQASAQLQQPPGRQWADNGQAGTRRRLLQHHSGVLRHPCCASCCMRLVQGCAA